MRILGIETSCDETAAAIVETDKNKSITLLSNVVASSMVLHGQTGGIIPEIAAREQIKYILPIVHEALKSGGVTRVEGLPSARTETESKEHSREGNPGQDPEVKTPDIDAIAVTVGPGLIGSLLVGVETAKTLSIIWNKPIIPVNHLFGHIFANFISTSLRANISERGNPNNKIASSSTTPRNDDVDFPAIALIVSGGHTDLVHMKNIHSLEWISGTRDDAAGEAFDKIGRLLNLTYPAGPTIEKLAKKGNPKRFTLPRPLLHENTLDFSFSGLKTAVLREVEKYSDGTQIELSESGSQNIRKSDDSDISDNPKHRVQSEFDLIIPDLARATQDAIIDVLIDKTFKAVEKYKAKSILLGGGVAANNTLREQFTYMLDTKYKILNSKLFAPAKSLCTDNAAMIAAAAVFNYIPTPWEKIIANPELYFD